MGVPSRFAFAVFLVVAASVGVADAWLGAVLSDALRENLREDLVTRTRLVAREVAQLQGDFDAAADALARDAGGRITIVDDEGRVLGDSALDPAAIAQLDNHANRPEFLDARAHGVGSALRASSTMNERMLYVAQHTRDGSGRPIFVRLAVSDASVARTLDEMHRLLFAAGLLALVLALFTGGIAVRWVSTSVTHLAETARRMASGDFGARTRMTGRDDMARLGRAMDEIAVHAEQSLRTLRFEKELLNGVLESMQEGVLVVDERDGIVLVNSALRAMFRLDGEVAGKAVSDVMPDHGLSALLRSARASLPASHAELDVPGRQLMVGASRLSGDSPGKFVLVFVDVTELRRLERVRRDFVANVSHELRTPVAIIGSAVESLMMGPRDDPALLEKFLGIVERNAQRLGTLIQDILELARLESGQVRLERVPLDVGELVERAVELLRPRAREKSQELRLDVARDAMAPVDARALGLVVSNLVENALKYSPQGAVVDVTVARSPDGVTVDVVDNGPGIPPEHLPRIFERFYRVDAGRSRDVGGTGLGLAIVKHLTDAMGGEVRAESAVGKGSRFSVRLPA